MPESRMKKFVSSSRPAPLRISFTALRTPQTQPTNTETAMPAAGRNQFAVRLSSVRNRLPGGVPKRVVNPFSIHGIFFQEFMLMEQKTPRMEMELHENSTAAQRFILK